MQPLSPTSSRALDSISIGQPLAGVGAKRILEAGRVEAIEPIGDQPADSATFSENAMRALLGEDSGGDQFTANPADRGVPEDAASAGPEALTKDDRAEVQKLQARDAEVRAHEQAHKAAAGSLASGAPTYEYETGPDGKQYAVGGEVGISISKGKTPQETLSKAERVQRAAQAPANPSSQDRAVSAKAAQMASEARTEIQEERRVEAKEDGAAETERTRGTQATEDSTRAYAQVKHANMMEEAASLLDVMG